MVKADMLYQLDIRLQEITEKIGTPFGGLSVSFLRTGSGKGPNLLKRFIYYLSHTDFLTSVTPFICLFSTFGV